MKKNTQNTFVWIAIELLSALFLLLFIYTATAKLSQLERFTAVLQDSTLIGPYAPTLAWLIPAVEILLSGLLFFPPTRRLGFAGAAVLMGVFTGYIGYMLLTQEKLPCACGGLVDQLTWPQHLMLNTTLTCCAIAGVLFTSKHKLFIAINRGS